MKYIWVVLHGERCEGGTVTGIYKKKRDARKKALFTDTCFEGGWTLIHKNYWENGCDYVEIERWRIK